jgi:hypothetical protein
MDEKGEVVAIKALPVKLTFNKNGVLSWHYQGVADVITTSAS